MLLSHLVQVPAQGGGGGAHCSRLLRDSSGARDGVLFVWGGAVSITLVFFALSLMSSKSLALVLPLGLPQSCAQHCDG